MFLSRLAIDGRLVVNPYEIHQAIWTLFPGMPQATRPFLYRLNPHRRGDALTGIMQSDVRPAEAGPAIRVTAGPKEFNLPLRPGQRLCFELTANPVKRLSADGARVPYVREQEQLDWLARKLAPGALLAETRIQASQVLYFRKHGRPGKLVAVTFAGLLEVAEPNSLLQTISAGIGPAKGFGCGLLSVAPA